MVAGKIIKRTLVAVVVLLAVTAAGLYYVAGRVPALYRPARLTHEERTQVANEFANSIVAFGNRCERGLSFSWSVTSDQLNEYLASMDEIASLSGKPGAVHEAMEQAGLADPAVALEAGVLTFMVRTRKYNKVVSLSLSFGFTEDGRLRVRPAGAKVGDLPVPDSTLRNQLGQLKRLLRPGGNPRTDAEAWSVPTEIAGEALATVVAAVNGEPVATKFKGPTGRKRVRIESIEIDRDKITLRVVPAE